MITVNKMELSTSLFLPSTLLNLSDDLVPLPSQHRSQIFCKPPGQRLTPIPSPVRLAETIFRAANDAAETLLNEDNVHIEENIEQ